MFKSNEELFKAVNELIANLEKRGCSSAAQELKKGFQLLNELTDGRALFLEAIEKLQDSISAGINSGDLEKFHSLYETVYFSVY